MKKREKRSSRKRTALRRCAVLAAVVLLVSAMNLYHFLPIQAVWDMADMNDIEHPEAVRRFYDGALPVTRFALHYLVDGDYAMMLCMAGYHPLIGWYDRSYAKAETWDGTGLYAGVYEHYQDGAGVAYLFGRIDDPRIQELRLRITEGPYKENPVTQTVEIPEGDIWEQDGKRYFLSALASPSGTRTVYHLSGLDEEGRTVRTVEAVARSWST